MASQPPAAAAVPATATAMAMATTPRQTESAADLQPKSCSSPNPRILLLPRARITMATSQSPAAQLRAVGRIARPARLPLRPRTPAPASKARRRRGAKSLTVRSLLATILTRSLGPMLPAPVVPSRDTHLCVCLRALILCLSRSYSLCILPSICKYQDQHARAGQESSYWLLSVCGRNRYCLE